MTETDFQNNIQEHIRKQWKGDVFKVHGNAMQSTGQPDLIGWVKSPIGGLAIAIEVKTPIGKPTELQVVRLRRYHQSGAYVAGIVVYPSDLDKLIAAYVQAALELRDVWGVMQELGVTDPYYIYHERQLNESEPKYR